MKSNHGAAIFDYSEDGKLIDFSSNINPLGPSEKVLQIIQKGISHVNRYPDYKYRKLYRALAQHTHVDETFISIGNGAMELIDAVITLYSKILIFNPCFSEYKNRAEARGKTIIERDMTRDFSLDYDALPEELEDTLVIVTNPNNPTGKSFEEWELDRLMSIVLRRGGGLLIDESFFQFTSKVYHSFLRASKNKHVFVINTATKFYSLPGLRLGYMVSCHKAEVDKKILEWSVSSILEEVGEAMFLDESFRKKSRLYIAKERAYLTSELNQIPNFKAYDSDANFILVKTAYDTKGLFQYLLDKGLLIRLCDNYKNLGKNHFRIAVKLHDDNLKLITALKEYKDE